MFNFFTKLMKKPRSVNFFSNETTFEYQKQKIHVQGVPHICPHCNREVGMRLTGIVDGPMDNGIQVLLFGFQCPSCYELTIGRYYPSGRVFTPAHTFSGKPYLYPQQEFQETTFTEEIYEKFPRFPVIYNQAEKAEHYGCVDIAGAGYRKAAEILIRDFACLMLPNEKEIFSKPIVPRMWYSIF